MLDAGESGYFQEHPTKGRGTNSDLRGDRPANAPSRSEKSPPQPPGGANLRAATCPSGMYRPACPGLRVAAIPPPNCPVVVILPPCPSLPPLGDGHACLLDVSKQLQRFCVAEHNSFSATKLSPGFIC